ncbi:MAG: hypothetical protein LBJ00_11310 [Planctomycetaceae bacterium]|nr:hypothetical protein [Planctomycetaceae bacterium]
MSKNFRASEIYFSDNFFIRATFHEFSCGVYFNCDWRFLTACNSDFANPFEK